MVVPQNLLHFVFIYDRCNYYDNDAMMYVGSAMEAELKQKIESRNSNNTGITLLCVCCCDHHYFIHLVCLFVERGHHHITISFHHIIFIGSLGILTFGIIIDPAPAFQMSIYL